MTEQHTLHLLLIDTSAECGETVINDLRNHGHAVRYRRVADLDAVNDSLGSELYDIVLVRHPMADCTLHDVAHITHRHDPEIPVIAICDNLLNIDWSSLQREGIHDAIEADRLDHIRWVIQREMSHINSCREVQHLRVRYQESELRCRALLASSRDAIAYIHDGMHHFCNDAYQAMFGYDNALELEGLPLLDMIHPDQRDRFKQLLREISTDVDRQENYRFILLRADQSSMNALLKFDQASLDGEPCLQLTVHDLTEQEAMESKLRLLSTQDLVTGLYNRPYFLNYIGHQLKTPQTGCQIAVMRLDNYNEIKDIIGIANCDVLLRDIAGIIGNALPGDALAARYCDDAFSFWLPDATLAQDIMNKVCQDIQTTLFDVENHSITTTCSIGLYTLTEEQTTAQSALSAAEASCNRAHEQGGNRVGIFSDQAPTTPPAAAVQGSEPGKIDPNILRLALQQDDFRLAYQPIVSLHAEPGERYETLLRLHANGRDIAPGEFLPVAEQHDLMADIDRWVIKKAIGQLALKRRQGKNTHFFIKLSEASLIDPALLALISAYLNAARLPGNCLTFEVAEKDLLTHLKHASQLAGGLAQLHCELAIEHVGQTGKPLTYLNHLEFKYLKINGEMIGRVYKEKAVQEEVKRITALAQSRGKLTIAEFVHDANTLATIWQFGVNFVQGYYLQHPDLNMNYDFSLD